MRCFYFGLALKLGMTVTAMLKQITSAEICEWLAFFELQNDSNKPKGQTAEKLRENFKRVVGR